MSMYAEWEGRLDKWVGGMSRQTRHAEWVGRLDEMWEMLGSPEFTYHPMTLSYWSRGPWLLQLEPCHTISSPSYWLRGLWLLPFEPHHTTPVQYPIGQEVCAYYHLNSIVPSYWLVGLWLLYSQSHINNNKLSILYWSPNVL